MCGEKYRKTDNSDNYNLLWLGLRNVVIPIRLVDDHTIGGSMFILYIYTYIYWTDLYNEYVLLSNLECIKHHAPGNCADAGKWWKLLVRCQAMRSPRSSILHEIVSDICKRIVFKPKSQSAGITVGDIDPNCTTFADDIAIIALYKSSLNHLLSLAYDFSKRKTWIFQFKLDKCEAMKFGKDYQPSKPIIMSETEIAVRTSYTHVGVLLCNNEMKIYDMVCEPIGAGRAVLHDARGLGSLHVLVTQQCFLNCIGL